MVILRLFICSIFIIRHCSTGGIQYPNPGTLNFAVFINSTKVPACSGTIISQDWVLTAASCVNKGDDIRVYAGLSDYNSNPDTTQTRFVIRKVIHPDYKEGLAGHDLALIQVGDFELNSTVGVLSLAGQQWPQENIDLDCISFGFGGMSLDKPGSNTKLKMWSSSASYGEQECLCTQRFQWRRLLCTKRVKGLGLCGQGDFGSGLVCYRGDNPFAGNTVENNSTRLFGVAHKMWNINSCKSKRKFIYHVKCDDMETVSTYMYMCPYLDWLREYVRDVPAKPPSCGAGAVIPQAATIAIFVVMGWK